MTATSLRNTSLRRVMHKTRLEREAGHSSIAAGVRLKPRGKCGSVLPGYCQGCRQDSRRARPVQNTSWNWPQVFVSLFSSLIHVLMVHYVVFALVSLFFFPLCVYFSPKVSSLVQLWWSRPRWRPLPPPQSRQRTCWAVSYFDNFFWGACFVLYFATKKK